MTMDYLAELIQEKGTVAAFPNYFKHVDRLIDLGAKSNVSKIIPLF